MKEPMMADSHEITVRNYKQPMRNRLIMMHEGRVVVDVKGEQKKELTIQSLLELFEKASGAEFDDPEALLTVD